MGILGSIRKAGRKNSDGFRFERPLVLLQSDDWGRVGVRDQEGRDELSAHGIGIGERPYDLYSLETAADLAALAEALMSVRDSAGQHPSLEMNFVVANVDFDACEQHGYKDLIVKALAEGLPGNWRRQGLFDAYREGIKAKIFRPALHGLTHFCQAPVLNALRSDDERGRLVRALWKCETPYIHWRMPWIGYEYWNPEKAPRDRFLSAEEQTRWITLAADLFEKIFGVRAESACAPGYRADIDTWRAWNEAGIRIAQNGPGEPRAPRFDESGLLHIDRSIDFEPALNESLTCDHVLKTARERLAHGLPFVISIHSINFHSTLAPFRERTIPLLRDLLLRLTKEYPDLLFVSDEQLLKIIETGGFQVEAGTLDVGARATGRGGVA
jgi:hypothetical protein